MSRNRAERAYERIVRSGAVGGWFGTYPGKVEATANRLGRVQVRVWAIHGDELRTPREALPWAIVVQPGSGAHDTGSFEALIEGSSVLITFLGGHRNYPCVLGSFHGVPDEDQAFLDLGDEDQPPWTVPAGEPETPKDVFEANQPEDHRPTRSVWRKSLKGHTIVVEDRDGEEFLKIIDRAGQVIEMSCPVTEEINRLRGANSAQRGVRAADRETQLPQEHLVEHRGYIRIRDVAGQEVMLDAREGHESISIISRDRARSTEQRFILSSDRGRGKVTLEDTSGNKLELNSDSGGEGDIPAIVLEDRAGSRVEFLPDSGSIKLKARRIDQETARGGSNKVEGDVLYEIGGSKKDDVFGNSESRVGGDFLLGVVGMLSKIVGGALKVLVANAGPAGVEPNAIELIAALGNVSLETKAGAATLKNLLGELSVNIAGLVTARSPAGSVTIDPAGGITILNAVGSIILSPTGDIVVNGGTIPCNDLPACLFTGAPHGIGTAVLGRTVLVP